MFHGGWLSPSEAGIAQNMQLASVTVMWYPSA